MLRRSFRNLLLFLFGSSSIGSTEIVDSVVPIVDKIQTLPPQKYSERLCAEISNALEKRDQMVRVVTFNVLFDLFDHQMEKIHSWPKRLERVSLSILNMQPDLLCVQETYPNQLEDLKKQLGMECFAGDCKTGELNAIFFNTERFERDDAEISQILEMPINPKDDALIAAIPDLLPPELEPGRRLTILHLKDKLTGKSLVVLNTHLTYYRVNTREDQVHYIVDLVNKFQAQGKTVILAGDFNTLPNRPEQTTYKFHDGSHMMQIFRTALKNTKETALLGHIGPISTYTKDFLKPGSKVFSEVGTPELILDHIFVSPHVTVLINAIEPSKVNGQFPSDHLPVFADILL